jgi:hypothetical protein
MLDFMDMLKTHCTNTFSLHCLLGDDLFIKEMYEN